MLHILTFAIRSLISRQIADWLAEKAKSCGYEVEPPPKAPRPKRKAREAAKAASATSQNAASSSTEHAVNVREFVPMAVCVASAKPRIRVPRGLSPILNRVIELRQACTDFYHGREVSPTTQTQTRK